MTTPVSQIMTRGVRVMAPNDTVIRAAQAMDELDIGVIPVCDGERLVGMLTDRDIVLRVVAQGLPPEHTLVSDVMSEDTCWCFENETLEDVRGQMQASQIRRVPVVDHNKRLVGIVSLGDLAVKADAGEAGSTLSEISEPAHPDRSGQSQASGAAGGGA